MLDRDEIAARLRVAREAKFETARAAADALGEKYPTYAGNENGTSPASIDRLAKYGRRFRVSLEWLLTGNGRGPKGKGCAADRISQIYEMAERMEDAPPAVQDRIIAYVNWELDRETATKPNS